MTHDERVYHHMYETNEGIAEHAERIASLEELVRELMPTARIAAQHGINVGKLADQERRARELGVEVE